jgi:hypothetical protein
MVMIIGVVVMVIVVIGHRVADGRTADSTHDRPDRTANNGAADGARDPLRFGQLAPPKKRRRSASRPQGQSSVET